jgi:hypothetical protein
MRLVVSRSFVDREEMSVLLELVRGMDRPVANVENEHIRTVGEGLMGESHIYDISGTRESGYLAGFQSSGNTLEVSLLPPELVSMSERVAEAAGVPPVNRFLQVVRMGAGGIIRRHYDTSMPGLVNFKCNLSLMSEDYIINVDKTRISVSEGDLYCFEASLYPHWSGTFTMPRVLLSYGFGVPYADLGLEESDPRVRLSERIYKVFQGK